MNKLVCSLFAVGAAALCVSAAPEPNEDARLAQALANYEQSGPTTDCVSERGLGNHHSVGHHTIIFDNGSIYRIWVNHPPGGCPDLDRNLTLVIRTTTDRFCRGDIAQVIDPVAHIPYGSCVLGDFTPYRRVSRH